MRTGYYFAEFANELILREVILGAGKQEIPHTMFKMPLKDMSHPFGFTGSI